MKFGNKDIQNFELGNKQVQSVWCGSKKIWEEVKTYTITPTLTNVIWDASNPTTIREGSTATLIFSVLDQYVLPDSISVTGANYTWTPETKTLVLSDPTGNVNVIIDGIVNYFWVQPINTTLNTWVGWGAGNGFSTLPTIQYSLDRQTWTTLSWGTESGWYETNYNLIAPNQKVYFRGIGNTRFCDWISETKTGASVAILAYTDNASYSLGSCNVGGAISSLLDYTNLGERYVNETGVFAKLFSGDPMTSYIIDASQLVLDVMGLYCYQYLFGVLYASGEVIAQINLNGLPKLPIKNLSEKCYSKTFDQCSNVKISETKVGNYQNEYRIPSLGAGVLGTDSLFYMFRNTGGTFTSTPLINTTYYTSNNVMNE